MQHLANERIHVLGQPNGVRVMFCLQVFSNISFSFVFSLLVLYVLTKLGFSYKAAYSLDASYNAFCYVFSIIASYIANRYIGYRRCLILGAVAGMIGIFLLAFPTTTFLYLGLALFVLSNATMVVAMYVLLDRLYFSDTVKRNAAFTLTYVASDVGALIATSSAGYISTYLSYADAYYIGAVFQLITLLYFLHYQSLFERKAGDVRFPNSGDYSNRKSRGYFLFFMLVPVLMILLKYPEISNSMVLVVGVICVGTIFYLAFQYQGIVRHRILVFFMFLSVSTFFDSLYFLEPSTLTVFIKYNVDRHLFHTLIPSASYMSLNPFFIITLAPIIAYFIVPMFWKFSLGMFSLALGYFLIVLGILFSGSSAHVNTFWIVASYGFQTVGELLISPTSYAMVGELIPPKYQSVMMGVSQFSSGVAGSLSGLIAVWMIPKIVSTAPVLTNASYHRTFSALALTAMSIGVMVLLLVPVMRLVFVRKINKEEMQMAA